MALIVPCSGLLLQPCVAAWHLSARGATCDWPGPTILGASQDATATNVINLRRTIYLTIMSAMDFEEAGHKLLKIDLADGQESEVVLMIIECCSQEKTYLKSAPSCL